MLCSLTMLKKRDLNCLFNVKTHFEGFRRFRFSVESDERREFFHVLALNFHINLSKIKTFNSYFETDKQDSSVT